MCELKPCPFCGGKTNITYNSSDNTFSIWHTNIRCGVAEPIKIDSAVTFDEAAKIWNRRTKDE
jgi:hypothetical protein